MDSSLLLVPTLLLLMFSVRLSENQIHWEDYQVIFIRKKMEANESLWLENTLCTFSKCKTYATHFNHNLSK